MNWRVKYKISMLYHLIHSSKRVCHSDMESQSLNLKNFHKLIKYYFKNANILISEF